MAPKVEEKDEKVMRREEKIKEMRQRKMAPGRGKYNLRRPGGFMNNNPFQQQQEEEEEDNHIDTYDRINGEKVLREYGSDGLRNAIHVIISQPQKSVFDFLLNLKVNPDLPDYDEVTPFNLMSTKNISNLDPIQKYPID